MNRLERLFKKNTPATVIYITAGSPDMVTCEAVARSVFDAGAEIIELGVPFSDPTADGLVIQRAAQRALAAGVSLADILALAGRLRRDYPEKGLVLFSYYNVLLNYGLERLCADAAAAGIDGVLAVDLPYEEKQEFAPILEKHGLDWITLISPATPPERAAMLLKEAKGFVYYITVRGVTGERSILPDDLRGKLDAVRAMSPVPVVAGFGISTPEQAHAVGACADGVVVGSAVMRILEDCPRDPAKAAGDFVRALRDQT